MRTLAAALSFAFLLHATGCRSAPGVALGTGIVLTGIGTLITIDVDPTKPDEEGVNKMVGAASITVALIGLGFMIAGISGYTQNSEAERQAAANAGISPQPAASPSATTAAPAPAERDDSQATGEHAKLVTHIRLAARANRCEAALFMLAQLEQRNASEASALRTGDEHVQRCQPAQR